MEITFKKSFVKRYNKLQKNNREIIDKTIDIFKENPFDPILKNHPLHGRMEGKRSIAAGNDLRVIFKIEGNYIKVIFMDVGTHNQVY